MTGTIQVLSIPERSIVFSPRFYTIAVLYYLLLKNFSCCSFNRVTAFVSTQYAIQHINVHFISKPPDLEQIQMEQIMNNSVAEKKIQTDKIFSSKFSVTLTDSVLTTFIMTMKISSNVIMS